jgi:hypothetical protein
MRDINHIVQNKYTAACMHQHVSNLMIDFNLAKINISQQLNAHIIAQINQLRLFQKECKFQGVTSKVFITSILPLMLHHDDKKLHNKVRNTMMG